MKVTLRVHSFIDIITNSSTEIYVQASDSTVKGVKKLIDALFKSMGVQYKAADMFEFSFSGGPYDEYQSALKQYADEIAEAKQEAEANGDTLDVQEFLSEEFGVNGPDYDDEGLSDIRLHVEVKPKFKDYQDLKIAAEILSDLTGLFGMQASYG